MTFNVSSPCQCIIIFQQKKRENTKQNRENHTPESKKQKAINYSRASVHNERNAMIFHFSSELPCLATFNPRTTRYFALLLLDMKCKKEGKKKLQLGNEKT